jgi:hypothetical protein
MAVGKTTAKFVMARRCPSRRTIHFWPLQAARMVAAQQIEYPLVALVVLAYEAFVKLGCEEVAPGELAR